MVRGLAIYYFMTRGLSYLLSQVVHPVVAELAAFTAVTSLIVYRLKKSGLVPI